MSKFALAMLAAIVAAAMAAPGASASTGDLRFDSPSGTIVVDKRGKPRVPGGSGCDDPEDIIEHPECQP
ncbi:MAG: hypothetical protein JNM29_07580 [Candidatus Odyssella sp.]|nr:hypothetical protein [Candidatus Odyssella sp.]